MCCESSHHKNSFKRTQQQFAEKNLAAQFVVVSQELQAEIQVIYLPPTPLASRSQEPELEPSTMKEDLAESSAPLVSEGAGTDEGTYLPGLQFQEVQVSFAISRSHTCTPKYAFCAFSGQQEYFEVIAEEPEE